MVVVWSCSLPVPACCDAAVACTPSCCSPAIACIESAAAALACMQLPSLEDCSRTCCRLPCTRPPRPAPTFSLTKAPNCFHWQDWKYLGEGAWAPKGKAAAGGGGKKGKGGPGSKSRSSSASPSGSQPAGSSAVGSDDEEGSGSEEEEEEEMEGDESAQSADPPAAGEQQAGRKRGAAAMAADSVSLAGPEAAAAAAEAEAQPPQKKARARTGRKRLDPIVRDALRAAEEKPGGKAGRAGGGWMLGTGSQTCRPIGLLGGCWPAVIDNPAVC